MPLDRSFVEANCVQLEPHDDVTDETDRRIAAFPDERLEAATERWLTAQWWEERQEHLDEIEEPPARRVAS